jgi:hypothetical protein
MFVFWQECNPNGQIICLIPDRQKAMASVVSLRWRTFMPRFHFNTRRGDEMMGDLEGEMLSDTWAAQDEAIAFAREMLIDSIKSGGGDPPDVIEVTDSDGRIVSTVVLADILPRYSRK